MSEDKCEEEYIRTTVYLPKKLHNKAKVMAALQCSTLSGLMKIALLEKIKELNEIIDK